MTQPPTDTERLVEELRAYPWGVEDTPGGPSLLKRAADALTSKDEEIASLRARGDQHWETLRSIRDMARAGDCERIIQWVNDAGTGYVETAQRTLSSALDRAQAAESLALSQAGEIERLRGALERVAELGAVVSPTFREAPGPDAIRISDGSLLTGEAADAAVELVRAVIDVGDLARAALSQSTGDTK